MDYKIFLASQMVWNVPLFTVLVALSILYALLIRPITKATLKKSLFFYVSMLLFYFAVGSPLATLVHLSYSTHMIQMSLLFFIIPPLFLLGIPDSLFIHIRNRFHFRKLFISPIISLYLFAIFFFMYHLDEMLRLLVANPLVHQGYISVLMILSFHIWWPLVIPDLTQRYCEGRRKLFIGLNGMLITPACLFFFLSSYFGNNPALTPLTMQLCLPSTITISPMIDPILDKQFAGFFMFGIHKLGLMLTAHKHDALNEIKCLCPFTDRAFRYLRKG
ncbi:cytochrome c oxidase assembly protein [Bacillus sp. FJAT-50079]|uniref:cytochrome c oxidase assembly protein n=1 Tax=Bacillus sp. FJAT-50079 TaxID=2833577 RepID=UPI001BC9A884|nr:cytochrome c oxidase assembly protein [Bacillus sp. FJAT-50079]MBS4207890.1 cytochrome c oxidase assembly protein [Bacillus sp. FJAT-50079]